MIHAVVVTYQPPDVTALLTELSRQCDAVTVVDNGSDSAAVAALRASCRATGAELVAMPANLGIAKAQNIGVARAMTSSPDFILLSDQDSLPAENMTALLVEAIEEDERIAATGPLPSEDREGADELVYIDRGWSPKRATKEELSRPRLDAAFLLASGCLIRVRALREIGPMREDLFIDHVDLEWGVRARRAGWRLVAVPAARLNHSLGDEAARAGPADPRPLADQELLHRPQHDRPGEMERIPRAVADPLHLLGGQVRRFQLVHGRSGARAAASDRPGTARRRPRPSRPHRVGHVNAAAGPPSSAARGDHCQTTSLSASRKVRPKRVVGSSTALSAHSFHALMKTTRCSGSRGMTESTSPATHRRKV